MMPTLFAGLCQMSKMSRVQRVLERFQVRFGICWLLVRCRGHVSPDAGQRSPRASSTPEIRSEKANAPKEGLAT